MTYYNGYGWNFYYNKGNYYASTTNAVYVQSGSGGIVGAIVGCIVCLIVVLIIVLVVTGKCGSNDDVEEN